MKGGGEGGKGRREVSEGRGGSGKGRRGEG